DEVTLARKGAKSRRRITGLRSKTTEARTHVDRLRAANADLKKKLAEALEQRRRPPRCCKSLAVRRAGLSRYFRPCWRMHFASARQSSACWTFIGTARLSCRPWSVRHLPLSTLCCANRLSRRPELPSTACCGQRSWSTPSMPPRKRESLFRPDWRARVRTSSCQC